MKIQRTRKIYDGPLCTVYRREGVTKNGRRYVNFRVSHKIDLKMERLKATFVDELGFIEAQK